MKTEFSLAEFLSSDDLARVSALETLSAQINKKFHAIEASRLAPVTPQTVEFLRLKISDRLSALQSSILDDLADQAERFALERIAILTKPLETD